MVVGPSALWATERSDRADSGWCSAYRFLGRQRPPFASRCRIKRQDCVPIEVIGDIAKWSIVLHTGYVAIGIGEPAEPASGGVVGGLQHIGPQTVCDELQVMG